jgi:hypothetical protein
MANNSSNLRPPTSEEARERGRKGGKASAKRRQAIKLFKDALKDGLTPLEQENMLRSLKRNAQRGNLPAFEFLLKMIGEHPDQLAEEDKDTTIKVIMEGTDDYGD